MFTTVHWGLKGRAIALCVILLLGTAGVLGTALIWQNYRDSLNTMTAHALVQTRSIAYAAEPAVLLNDPQSLKHVVETAAQDENVSEAEIIDANGKVLAFLQCSPNTPPKVEVHPDRNSKAIAEWNRFIADWEPTGAAAQLPEQGLGDRSLVHVRRDANRLVTILPIWPRADHGIDLDIIEDQLERPTPANKPVGFVRLTFSLDGIHAELTRRVYSGVLISTAVIIVGIAATVLTVRTLLRPLRNLVDTTAAIACGDRTKRVTAEAVGEIGELARSFNNMADRLEQSYASIERKVEDRTAELETRKRELETEITERRRAEHALRASETRLRRQNEVLVELSMSKTADRGDLRSAAEEINAAAAETLEVARASVWLYDEDRSKIRCLDLYERSRARHSEGLELQAKDFPVYFQALEHDRTIAAHNARTDPRTCEYLDAYLVPIGITSMLDAPIRLGSQVIGVLCCEHIGLLRHWALEEQQFAASMADLVALALEASERKRARVELERAKNAAEAASRAKSDFLANMSHEIRTPMTAILGFAENLLDPSLSESEKIDALNTIRRNGSHLLQIINDILDISRIEAGRLAIEQVACSPSRILADVASLMRPHAKARNLTFSVECLSAIPETIHTDPTRLHQILINLVGNGIKFTEHGGVTLRVGMLNPSDRRDSQPLLQFEVADTGIGMTREQIRRVFHPFTQADETMSRRFGGTGLGLAISQRLAEMLGGTIATESTLGEGSTFRLTVTTGPLEGVKLLAQPDLVLSADKDLAALPPAAEATLNCRILLAEDGPDNQRLIAHLLRKAGADVAVAENGRVAVDLALAAQHEGRPFDVILMDMQMPVMDGYGATSLLRAKGYTGTIIALTAHAMSTDRDRCLHAGCDEFATKPIKRKALIELIRQCVGDAPPVATSTDG